MQISVLGTPITRSFANASAEKADVQITRDDGTQETATTRAIKMHVDDTVVEAWNSVVEGQTWLAVASWKTLNVLGDGQVGRVVNVAVQDGAGELTVEPNQYVAGTLQNFGGIQDVETYVTQVVAQAQQAPPPSP